MFTIFKINLIRSYFCNFNWVNSSYDSILSWLKPQLKLKYFQLGSARGLLTVSSNFFFSLKIRKSQFFATIFFLTPKIGHFKKKHYYLQQIRLKIIQFLHKMTNFWIKKKKLQLKSYLLKKILLVFSSKIKVPQLDSARNFHSSCSLEPEKSSSNSSLLVMWQRGQQLHVLQHAIRLDVLRCDQMVGL